MAGINQQSSASGFDMQRVKGVLVVVYGLLSAVNFVVMITEPTAWQGVFAAILLIAALGLCFDTPQRTNS
ncbi:hypothetical protein [Lentzea nigeriaca]|uniref:hypothetical protein n=1 Tax=Lentzea nigeriaca TaxID=1128665 RepID=UPI00195A59E8|nr:hypothetical protein [Lentzea nigeriaca]MBM7859142.1 nitrogen fixation protein FixH [Lentzea nigeriaca]